MIDKLLREIARLQLQLGDITDKQIAVRVTAAPLLISIRDRIRRHHAQEEYDGCDGEHNLFDEDRMRLTIREAKQFIDAIDPEIDVQHPWVFQVFREGKWESRAHCRDRKDAEAYLPKPEPVARVIGLSEWQEEEENARIHAKMAEIRQKMAAWRFSL